MNFVITYDARSGSTLVSKLLTENFNSVVLPESNFIYIIEKNFDNKKKLYSKLISEKKFSDFRIKKKRLLNLINNNFKNKYDLIKLISYEASFNLYKSKKFRIGIKKSQVDYLENLCRGINKLNILHLIRDPREVAVSYASHSGISIEEQIEMFIGDDKINRVGYETKVNWMHSYKSWKSFKSVPNIFVKYEELIRDPINFFSSIVYLLSRYTD